MCRDGVHQGRFENHWSISTKRRHLFTLAFQSRGSIASICFLCFKINFCLTSVLPTNPSYNGNILGQLAKVWNVGT